MRMPANARPRGGCPRAKIIILGLVGLIVTTSLAGCFSGGDPSYPYAVLNDGDAPVIVEVREEHHETYVVPPHAYGWLFEARSPSGPGWVISTVDQRCDPIASWPVDGDHNLLYVGPTAQVKFTKGDAYNSGLGTARSVILAAKPPPCQDFVGSIVNDSNQPVVLDGLGLVHQTWLVPPHAWVPCTASPLHPARVGNSTWLTLPAMSSEARLSSRPMSCST